MLCAFGFERVPFFLRVVIKHIYFHCGLPFLTVMLFQQSYSEITVRDNECAAQNPDPENLHLVFCSVLKISHLPDFSNKIEKKFKFFLFQG